MNERQITLITLAFLALFIIGGGIGVWYLQFNVLSKKKEGMEALRKKVVVASKKKDSLKKLRIEVNNLRKKETEEIQRIPNLDNNEYDGFVDQLNQMRRQSGVFLRSASTARGRRVAARGGTKLPTNVDKVSYDLTVSGNFYPLLRFINLIETNKRYIQIDSAKISSSGGRGSGSGGSLRELKVKVTTYAFKISEAAKKKTAEPVDGTQVIDSTPVPSSN